jgi:iron complex outermembrane receptor protein
LTDPRKYLKSTLFVGLLLSLFLPVAAQNFKDTLRLPVFEVKSGFISDNQGFKKERLDSSILIHHIDADLSKILIQNSTIFIKSYGNGTLSTPSFRGTTAQHTQVEWNGINLNSPMLGQIDLSQIPVSQFDEIEILYGAAGISRTSGAFGGVINMATNPNWDQRLKATFAQTIGSFNTYTTNLNFIAGNPSFQSQTKANYSSSLNDFTYFNDYLGTNVKQQNSSYSSAGITQELFWKIKDKHLISGHIWYNFNNNNLPPTTTEYDQNHIEKQKDEALRAVLEYKFVDRKFNVMIRSCLVDQYMNYQLDSNLNTTHRYYSWINRIRCSFNGIRNLTIKPGLDFTRDWVNSDSYDGVKTRNTTSFYAEISHNFKNTIKTSLIVREDLINEKFLPIIPALGLEYAPFKKINWNLTFNLARNYRYPTLNDQFWILSGNPDLKPETNYTIEIGSNYHRLSANGKFFIEANISGYYMWIYDMITWLPVEGSNLWKPENIDEVLARGLEIGLNLKLEVMGFYLAMTNNYAFCKSTYEKANSEYDKKIGKQLIYVPMHNLNSTLSLERWKFFLSYNFCFVSDRFTGKDNLSIMPAYCLSNILFGKNISMKDFLLSLQIEINNVFNLDYQSIANRPMAGLNYAFTLKFSYSTPRKR